MNGIEWITDEGRILSVIICRSVVPTKTTFIAPDEFLQQADFVVNPKGGNIANHTHKPIERHITGTLEKK